MSKIKSALKEFTRNPGAHTTVMRSETVHSRASEASDVVPGGQGEMQNSNSAQSIAAVAERAVAIDYERLLEEGIVVADDKRQQLREEIRCIKWPVVNNAFGAQSDVIPSGNVVMIASSTSGEGKTFTAINLAMSLAAERDLGVLLVDADIAKPHASELFGAQDCVGVTDVLSGEVTNVQAAVLNTDLNGLKFLPAGRADEHASELLASNRMRELVDQLVAEYPRTIILFDSSPILQTNESQVLSHVVGQVILVVGAGKTPRHAVQETVRRLGPDLVVNVVLNGVKGLFGQQGQYGGYYGYHSRR